MIKKFFLLLLAVIFVVMALFASTMMPITLAFASPTLSKPTFFDAIVKGNNVNVRQGPTTGSPVVCVLNNGAKVEVYGNMGNWYLIYNPSTKCVGMVFGQYLKPVGQSTPPKPDVKVPPKPTAIQKPMPIVTSIPTSLPTAAPSTPSKAPQATTMPPQPSGTSITPTAEENELLGYVNEVRKSAGAGALQFDSSVIKTARLKARDMVEKNYFSHQSPTYGSPFDMLRQFNVSFKSAGENIAGNQTVKGAFDAWMKSEGHKKNILNAGFNFAGFGIEQSPTYGKILVQQFIGR